MGGGANLAGQRRMVAFPEAPPSRPHACLAVVADVAPLDYGGLATGLSCRVAVPKSGEVTSGR